MTTRRLLILGHTGQVGTSCKEQFSDSWDILCPDLPSLSLANRSTLQKLFDSYEPDAVVNAAAYTAVDKAEDRRPEVSILNYELPKNLAGACQNANIPLVHFSSDYVFDGRKETPYVEGDPVNPLSYYGQTKLAGDEAVMSGCVKHFIIRTTWVYSPIGKNFVKTIMKLAQNNDHIRVVADQNGSPTSAGSIALAAASCLSGANPKLKPGLYHFTASQWTNWYEFACAIVRKLDDAGFAKRLEVRNIMPIPTSQYPTPAKRPLNSRLNCQKWLDSCGANPKSWTTQLNDVMGRILNS